MCLFPVEFTVWYLVRFCWKCNICHIKVLFYVSSEDIHSSSYLMYYSACKMSSFRARGQVAGLPMIISEHPLHVVSSLQCRLCVDNYQGARAMIWLQMFGKWSEESDFLLWVCVLAGICFQLRLWLQIHTRPLSMESLASNIGVGHSPSRRFNQGQNPHLLSPACRYSVPLATCWACVWFLPWTTNNFLDFHPPNTSHLPRHLADAFNSSSCCGFIKRFLISGCFPGSWQCSFSDTNRFYHALRLDSDSIRCPKTNNPMRNVGI